MRLPRKTGLHCLPGGILPIISITLPQRINVTVFVQREKQKPSGVRPPSQTSHPHQVTELKPE